MSILTDEEIDAIVARACDIVCEKAGLSAKIATRVDAMALPQAIKDEITIVSIRACEHKLGVNSGA